MLAIVKQILTVDINPSPKMEGVGYRSSTRLIGVRLMLELVKLKVLKGCTCPLQFKSVKGFCG